MSTHNLFYALLSFIPALLNIGIIIYILLFLPRNKTADLFALFVIALVLWQIEDTYTRLTLFETNAFRCVRMLGIGWIVFAPITFHFVCRYTSLKILLTRASLICLYLPFVLFALIYISNDVKPVFLYYSDWGWINLPRPGTPDGVQRYLLSLLIIVALFMIFRYAFSIRENKEKRKQAFIIAFGMLIPSVQGITTQVIFPLVLHWREVPLTSTFLTFFSFATIVALTRYELFNISDYIEVETVLQNLKSIVLVIAPDQRVLYMNPHARQLLGATQDASGFTQQGVAYFECHTEILSTLLNKTLAGEVINNHLTTFKNSENDPINVLVSTEVIRSNNKVQGIILVASDVTEQVKTLDALKESNERDQFISMATSDMVWDWNPMTGVIHRSSEGWKKLFHDDQDETQQKEQNWDERIHPEDYNRVMALKQEILNPSSKNYYEVECRMCRSDGTCFYMLDRAYVIRDNEGKAIRLIGAAQDITKIVEAEKKLIEEQNKKHKEITEAVIIAQENERKKIGAELHENVSQILASSLLYVNLARTTNAPHLLEKSERGITLSIQELRKISHTLTPPSLNGVTLTEALNDLVLSVLSLGLFTIDKHQVHLNESLMPETLKLSIFRIIQEQFNNIIKYSDAKKVKLELIDDNEEIKLYMLDDGKGFDTSKTTKGVGLMNIKTRASLHNGNVRIVSAPGEGCVLCIVFPQPSLEISK